MQTFRLDHVKSLLLPVSVPDGQHFQDILNRVLRIPSVASKRYLTNKVLHLQFSFFFCISFLHRVLASGAVYCNRSCLCVCGGWAVSEPYYSQRARSVFVSERFFHS